MQFLPMLLFEVTAKYIGLYGSVYQGLKNCICYYSPNLRLKASSGITRQITLELKLWFDRLRAHKGHRPHTMDCFETLEYSVSQTSVFTQLVQPPFATSLQVAFRLFLAPAVFCVIYRSTK